MKVCKWLTFKNKPRNSGSRWWTGRPGRLQSMGSQRLEHDWATELNWIGGRLKVITIISWSHIYISVCFLERKGRSGISEVKPGIAHGLCCSCQHHSYISQKKSRETIGFHGQFSQQTLLLYRDRTKPCLLAFFFNWSIVDLQCCVSFWCTAKWFTHIYVCVYETPILWPPHAKSWLIGKDPDAQRDWGQEEKGTTEGEMAGWHHRLDGHEFEWTPGIGDGQGGLADLPGVLQFMGSQSDTTERLNWTELCIYIYTFSYSLHYGLL